MRSKRSAYMFMFLMALLCIGLCFFDSFPDKAVATQSGGQNNCPTGSSAGGGAACDKCKTAGQTCGDTWDEWYHDPDDDDDNLSPGSISGPKFICVGVESLYTVVGSSDKDKWREMQNTQANSTGCPCTGGDEEQSAGTATDSFQVAAWSAEGQPIVVHGGLQGKLTPNAAGKYDITATVGDLAVQLPTDTGSRDDPDQDTDAFEVTVIAVDSLTPSEGTEVDDGDNDPNTRVYVVPVAASGTITVTAASTPVVAESALPSCWNLVGGTGTGKLTRTISKADTGKYEITASAGGDNSKKKITVYVAGVGSISTIPSVVCTDAAHKETVTATLTDNAPLPAGMSIVWGGDATFSNASGLSVDAKFAVSHVGDNKKITAKLASQSTAVESNAYSVAEVTSVTQVSGVTYNITPVTPPSDAYGITTPKGPEFDITAYFAHSDHKWHCKVTSATNEIEQGVHLNGRSEITVAACTSESIYQNMIFSIEFHGEGILSGWYMLAAVQAHEDLHANSWKSKVNGNTGFPLYASQIGALTVDYTAGTLATAAQAKTAIKNLPAYDDIYLTIFSLIVQNYSTENAHPASDNVTFAAEEAVTGPMKTALQQHAASQNPPWGFP